MKAPEAPGWMVAEMAEGLQRLVLLRLEGAASADSIAGVAMAWADAMMVVGIAWDEAQDVPRLKMAFRLLASRLERWPAPKHLLEALPARPEPRKLPAPPATEADRERARVMLASITKKLRMPQHESSSPGKLRTPKARG